MKIVFMGTPDFAVPTLQAIIDAGHEVVAVVTQPDKPKGRGGQMTMPPVKELAVKYGIEVLQPVRLRKDEEFLCRLEELAPDVIVVVAFGQILPKRVLDLPVYGCINVHASLLPKYRGSAPIQWAVIDGEKYSGVTIMQMDEGVDTGDIICKAEYELAPDETGGSLFDRLAGMGGRLLTEVLDKLPEGVNRIPQGESPTAYAKMLEKDMGRLDFTKNADELERLIRGLNPWPSAFTHLDGKTLKIWKAEVTDAEGTAGTIVALDKNSFTIACGARGLRILELQLEGKKRMSCGDFLRGYSISEGTKLEY